MTNSPTYSIIMIGNFPPPVHGMSAANQAVYERLIAEGWRVEKLNTAPRSLNRRMMARLWRLPAILRAWRRLLTIKLSDKDARPLIYIAISGGLGQSYDLVTIAICRIRRLHCILHHHSFAYLGKRSLLTAWLCHLAGLIDAGHVVLCQQMKHQLKELYDIKKVVVLSNIALFPLESQPIKREALRVVGFLSNITYEKGGGTVIALAEAFQKHGLELKMIVAGPCEDDRLVKALESAETEKNVLKWIGPVYGNRKEKFWQVVDVFIFPTQYANEAEPFVVWEALAASTPVIAYDRGCIASQLKNGGIIVPPNKDFVEVALNVFKEWQNPAHYNKMSLQARGRYREARAMCESSWAAFKELLQGHNTQRSAN